MALDGEDTKAATMPTLFIPHGGGPCFFMDWSPKDTWDKTAAWLRGLADTLPERPKAIVVVSGHWEEPVFTVATSPAPGMIYDYSNFPPHTYELQYPAPGAPALAAHVVELLRKHGLPAATDPRRGFDHGVFIPFLLVFPDAEIPVVPMSLKDDLDPEEHMAAGLALASLRDEGVLIVGSGMSYHNMRAFSSPAATEASETFDRWLTQAVQADPDTRRERLAHWAEAPAGRASHPREEHLLPLMVAAGAAGADEGRRVFSDIAMNARLSGFRFG